MNIFNCGICGKEIHTDKPYIIVHVFVVSKKLNFEKQLVPKIKRLHEECYKFFIGE